MYFKIYIRLTGKISNVQYFTETIHLYLQKQYNTFSLISTTLSNYGGN